MDLNPNGVGDHHGYPPYHPALGSQYPPAPAYHHTAGPSQYDGNATYNNGLGIYTNGYHYNDYSYRRDQHRTERFPSDQNGVNCVNEAGWSGQPKHIHAHSHSEISQDAKNNAKEKSLCKREYFIWEIQDSMYQYNTAAWICDLCQECFKKSQDLNVHYYQYHINPHLISPADARLYRVSNFLVQTHEDSDVKSDFPASYRCHQCFNVFTLPGALRIHLQKHNMPEPVKKKSPKTEHKISDPLPISTKTKDNSLKTPTKTPTKRNDASDKAFEDSPKVIKNKDKKTKMKVNKALQYNSQDSERATYFKDANTNIKKEKPLKHNSEASSSVTKHKKSNFSLIVEDPPQDNSKSGKMVTKHKHSKTKVTNDKLINHQSETIELVNIPKDLNTQIKSDSEHKLKNTNTKMKSDEGHKHKKLNTKIEHTFEASKTKSKHKKSFTEPSKHSSEVMKIVTKQKDANDKVNSDQHKTTTKQKDSQSKVKSGKTSKHRSEHSIKVTKRNGFNTKMLNGKSLKHKKHKAVTEKENLKRTKSLRRQQQHDSMDQDDSNSTDSTKNHLDAVLVERDADLGRPRRKASSRIQRMRELGSEVSDEFNSHSDQESSSRPSRKRPQRECKDRTSTLVAISLAEQDYEKFDLDFERFKSDVNSPTPSEGSRIGMRAVGDSDGGENGERVKDKETEKLLDGVVDELENVAPIKNGFLIKVEDIQLPSKSSKNKITSNKAIKKRSGQSKNIKPQKKIKKMKTKKTKKTISKKIATKIKKFNEKSQAKVFKSKKKDSLDLKEMQESVPPKKRVKTSKGWRPSITDTSKATLLVGSIVQEPSEFSCLSCNTFFPSYNQLYQHKVELEGCLVKTDLRVPPIFHPKLPDLNQLHVSRYRQDTSMEYSQYVTGSVVQVPEETFNNMHGQLSHLGTKDASLFAAHPLNEIGLVKLNYSGRWCVRNVWESLGWEPRNDQLSWQQYELATQIQKQQDKINREKIKREEKSENGASHVSNGDCSELALAEIKTEDGTNELDEVNEAVLDIINYLIDSTVMESRSHQSSGRTSPAPHCRPGPSLLQSVVNQLTTVVVSRQNPIITNKSVDRNLIQHLSHIPWNEQRMVKKAFDSILTNRKQRKSSETLKQKTGTVDGGHRQSGLPSKLGLKQVGKSIKYMKVQEREAVGVKEKSGSRGVEIVKGQLNGELEGEHRYLCTVCAEEYDDLQEVMHHKWESHPFCLVAHVTYSDANVSPPTMCYPQVKMTPAELWKSEKKIKVNGSSDEKEGYTCSKCQERLMSRDDFHIHILICSGIVNWTDSPKKRKGKRGKTHGGGLKHVINNFNRRMQAKQESGGTDTDGESTPKKRTRTVKEVAPVPFVPQHSRTTRLKENMKKVVKNLAAKERRKAKKDQNKKVAVNLNLQEDASKRKVKRKIQLDDNTASEEEIISDVIDGVISKIERVENAKKLKPRRSSWITQKREGKVSQLKRLNSVMSSGSSSTSGEDLTNQGSSENTKRRKSMLRDRQGNHYKEASSSESSMDDSAFKEMNQEKLKSNLDKPKGKVKKSKETKMQLIKGLDPLVMNGTEMIQRKSKSKNIVNGKIHKTSNTHYPVALNGSGYSLKKHEILGNERMSESKENKTSRKSNNKVVSKKGRIVNNSGSIQKKKPSLSKVNPIQYDLIEKHVHDAVSSIIEQVATGKIDEALRETSSKPLIKTPSKAIQIQIEDDNNLNEVSDHARLTPKSAKKRSRSPSLEGDKNSKSDDDKTSERSKKVKSGDDKSSKSLSFGGIKKINLDDEPLSLEGIELIRTHFNKEDAGNLEGTLKHSHRSPKSLNKRSKSPSMENVKKLKQDKDVNDLVMDDFSSTVGGELISKRLKNHLLSPKKATDQSKRRHSFTKGKSHPNRIVFPLEVKISALERLEVGETQASVAKDLQIGLSTIAKWWRMREDIMMQGAGMMDDEEINQDFEERVGLEIDESKLELNNDNNAIELKSDNVSNLKDLIKHVNGRLSIPREVKMAALSRVEGGETQSSVARDLQVGISTVACWWAKRESIRKLGSSIEPNENAKMPVNENTKDTYVNNDSNEHSDALKYLKEGGDITKVLGRRQSFSLDIKLNAIDRIENGEAQVSVARDLKVNTHTVAAWWNRREKILKRQSQVVKNPQLAVNDSSMDSEDNKHVGEEKRVGEDNDQDDVAIEQIVEDGNISDDNRKSSTKGLNHPGVTKKFIKKKKRNMSEELKETKQKQKSFNKFKDTTKSKNMSSNSHNSTLESQTSNNDSSENEEEDQIKIKKISKKFQDFSPEVMTGSRDRRGSTCYTHSQSMPDSQGRLIMPLEVKQSAIRRILDGDTKAQVARDLGCPLSTISTWWKKKGNILDSEELMRRTETQNSSPIVEQETMQKLFQDVVKEDENKENDEEVKITETVCSKKDFFETNNVKEHMVHLPSVKRSEVLKSMRKSLEDAFSDEENQHELIGNIHEPLEKDTISHAEIGDNVSKNGRKDGTGNVEISKKLDTPDTDEIEEIEENKPTMENCEKKIENGPFANFVIDEPIEIEPLSPIRIEENQPTIVINVEPTDNDIRSSNENLHNVNENVIPSNNESKEENQGEEEKFVEVICDEKNENLLKESKEVQSSEEKAYLDSEKLFVEHVEISISSKEKSAMTKEDRELGNARKNSTSEEFKNEQLFVKHADEVSIIEKSIGEKEVKKEEINKTCAISKNIFVNTSPEGVSKTTCFVKPKKKSLDFLTSKLFQKALAKSQSSIQESNHTDKTESLLSKSNSFDNSKMTIFQNGALDKSKPLKGSLGQSTILDNLLVESRRSSEGLDGDSSKALEVLTVEYRNSSLELNQPSVSDCIKTLEIVNSSSPPNGILAKPNNLSVGSIAKPNNPSNGSLAKPTNDSNGSFDKPNNPSNGSLDKPSNPSNGSLATPNNPLNGSLAKPNNPSKGSLSKPNNPSIGSLSKPNNPSNGSLANPINPSNGSLAKPNNPSNCSLANPSNPSNRSQDKLINPSNGSLAKSNLPNTSNCPMDKTCSLVTEIKETLSFAESEPVLQEHPIVQSDPTISLIGSPIVQRDPAASHVDSPIVQSDPTVCHVDSPIVHSDPTVSLIDSPIVHSDPAVGFINFPIVHSDPAVGFINFPIVHSDPTVDSPIVHSDPAVSLFNSPIIHSDPTVIHVDSPIDKAGDVAPVLPSPVLGGLGLLMNSYGSDDDEEEEDM